MWCCLGLCLTLFAFGLVRFASAPQLQAVAARGFAELPSPRCPAQTLEADGVCVPVPAPSEEQPREPGALPPRGLLAPELVKQFYALQAWLVPLAEAPVPVQFQGLAGHAVLLTYAIATPFFCPRFNFPIPKIEAIGADWLLLRSQAKGSPTAHVETDILLLIAGVQALAAPHQLPVGTLCTGEQPLGVTREFVTLSARRAAKAGTLAEQFRLGETLDIGSMFGH